MNDENAGGNDENLNIPKRRSKQSKPLPRTKEVEIKNIFGPIFKNEILKEIHLKLYNFLELPDQDK